MKENIAKAWLQSSSLRYRSDKRASSGVKHTCPQKSSSPTPRIRKPTYRKSRTITMTENTVKLLWPVLCCLNSTTIKQKQAGYLQGPPTPAKTGSQDVSVGNDEKCQKNSWRQQPDERPPFAITAVACVTSWANQRDKQEAEHWTNACEQKQGRETQEVNKKKREKKKKKHRICEKIYIHKCLNRNRKKNIFFTIQHLQKTFHLLQYIFLSNICISNISAEL